MLICLAQAGPVKAPSTQYASLPSKSSAVEDGDESEQDGDQASDDDEGQDSEDSEEEAADESMADELTEEEPSRKRKRGKAADNLEDAYIQRIAREELKDISERRAEQAKKRKLENDRDESSLSENEEGNQSSEEEDESSSRPVHESLTGAGEATELDKSGRTVFLGNVSNIAIKSKSAKKTLLTHLASFLSTLPSSDVPHQVESIRFRSTAYATKLGTPRRAAFAHKDVMDATTASTNAYAVYSTTLGAQKASGALNGSVVLDRHLRVDSVAHPAAIDHKRCVFVGNLDFVDQETADDEDEESTKKKAKSTVPADVEEGLWRAFNAHTGKADKKNSASGNVESVRVVRDQATRVGKGFAYVQFYDPNCVEAALLLDGKKFPPLLPRKLRVVRAKKINKKRDNDRTKYDISRDIDGTRHTLQGRAKRLLGKAGAARVQDSENARSFIFEGQRATEGSGRLKMKMKSRGGGKGKPKNRSSRRAAAFRSSSSKHGPKETKA